METSAGKRKLGHTKTKNYTTYNTKVEYADGTSLGKPKRNFKISGRENMNSKTPKTIWLSKIRAR